MASHKLTLKQPQGRELLGGDLLAQCLQQLGVDVIFGLHGGHLDAFLMGCTEIGIELIDTRHETVAVQAAEGYAKVSGKTGCCFVTANSGFCNGLPGLATAFADRSPILCVTSSQPLRDAETNALQGFHDQVVLAKPITKFAARLTTVTEIPRIVSYAWRTARSGAPGPVLLDFPIDVLFTPVDAERVAWGNITGPLSTLPGPDPNAIKDVVSLIKAAERPAIIVGTGARSAIDEITTLASTTSLPIFHSLKFSTGIPVTHPSHAGSAVLLGLLRATQQPQPDLIILLGARTGCLLGGRGGAIVPTSNCKIIQIDIDGGEIGRSEHIIIGIVSDIQLAIAALNSEVAKADKFTVPESWIRTALGLKSWRAPHNESEPKIDEKNGHLHPYHAVKTLYRHIPKGSVISIDGGEAGGWAMQLLPEASASLSMLATGYLGFLGNGWGYSLGAAVADRSKLVINIQGDGSAGFHLAELDTYKKFNLRILTVVVNNSVWGMSQAGQELIYGVKSAKPASALRPETRYDIIAQGFGMTGFLIDATLSLPESPLSERRKPWVELGPEGEEKWKKCLNGLGMAVEEIVQSGGPGLIDLRVSPYPYQDSTKAMVGATKDPDVIVVPYYDNLPRPYYKSKENGAA
ncbi:acetolactate synthase I/II/III large subunit [Cucurbitaria berberidis CBS 394.84]|uniref:Acetolactate synthase I/II/III large subunit n=1 Tax=Cucurbitaria berberidis CBS 394.84 TaxID=1168544 RepID=A0A9P4GDD0_9PLEO|nr:acetolactate synthase I/II/III large subunit [Cucurbitaria berberidis CBS 394.84]KAF1843266.1 acetolactate synthase I/II/III large subunit [Cucurbitaria berberidis CBS 394.84]